MKKVKILKNMDKMMKNIKTPSWLFQPIYQILFFLTSYSLFWSRSMAWRSSFTSGSKHS